MKIVQNVLFRPCGGRFGQIVFFNLPDPKIALRDWNSRQYVKTVGFLWKLSKTCFSGHAEDVLAKSHFSTFQIHKPLKGLKLTPIRENSRLSMKIVQNVLFRPCGGRFGQFAFFKVLDPKIALPDWNSRQYVKTVGFQWNLCKTCFSGHAEHVLAKSHFSTFQIQKSLCRFLCFYENCTKRTFQAMRRTFWPNRIFQRSRSKNRSAGLKFTPINKNGRLSMKIVQNVLFRPCGGRFGQIAFVRANLSKSSRWPQILSKTGKQCAFQENCTKPSFQVMRRTFWPNRIFQPSSFQNRSAGSEIHANTSKQ